MEAQKTQPLSFGEVWQISAFRRLWLGQLVSLFGDFLALFAVLSHVSFKLHATAAQVTFISVGVGPSSSPPPAQECNACSLMNWPHATGTLTARCCPLPATHTPFTTPLPMAIRWHRPSCAGMPLQSPPPSSRLPR